MKTESGKVTASSTKALKPPHFWTLDVIRGLAILSIIAFHVLPLQRPLDPTIAWLEAVGPASVSLFFVLSGFSVRLSHLRQKENLPLSWNQFFLRRFRRLYPPYLGAIVLALTLNIVWSLLRGRNLAAFLPSPADLISHLLLVHTFHPQTFFGIIPALWFVGVLTYLYLLYPLFCRLIQDLGENRALLLVFLVTLGSRMFSHTLLSPSAPPDLIGFIQNNVLQRWFEWCLGAFIAARVVRQEALSLLLSVGGGISFACWLLLPQSQGWVSDLFFGVGIACLLWYVVDHESQWKLHPLWRPCLWLGQLSYPIFLLHQVFVPYVRSAMEPSPMKTLPMLLVIMGIVMLITIPLSILFHLFLEKPIGLRSR